MVVQYSSLSSSDQRVNPYCYICHKNYKGIDRVVKYGNFSIMMAYLHEICLGRLQFACLTQKSSSFTSRCVVLNRTLFTAVDRIEDFNRRQASGDFPESDLEVQELKTEIDELQKELAKKSKSIFSSFLDSCIIS